MGSADAVPAGFILGTVRFMNEITTPLSVRALSEWPAEQVERVWRLSSGALRRGSGLDGAQVARLEAQAGALGEELVRRGRL
jgi:hypothetical protein